MTDTIIRWIQTILLVFGVVAICFTYLPGLNSAMTNWWLLASVAAEGWLAIWIVHREKRLCPGGSFGEKLLPAMLPFIVIFFAVIRLFGII